MQTNRNTNTKRDVWQIAGDGRSKGVSQMNLANAATLNPVVYYKGRGMERFLTLDVYQLPNTPMYVLLYCPLCQARNPNIPPKGLTIKEDQKKIHLDPNAFPKFPGITNQELVSHLGLDSLNDLRGLISIETFECTFEEDPTLTRGFGFSGCGWKISIDNNIAKDR